MLSSSTVGSCPVASLLSFPTPAARTPVPRAPAARPAAAGAAISVFGEDVAVGVTTGLTSLGVAVLVSAGVVVLAAAEVDALEPGVWVFEFAAEVDAPFFGSGSSNSSADKHPILRSKPEKPDRFFFRCVGFFVCGAAFVRVVVVVVVVVVVAGPVDEVAAGVFSVVTGLVFVFLSPLADVLLLDDNLRVRVSIGPLPFASFFC